MTPTVSFSLLVRVAALTADTERMHPCVLCTLMLCWCAVVLAACWAGMLMPIFPTYSTVPPPWGLYAG